jgi:hypothetical protein
MLPSWLTTLISLIQAVPEIIAIIEKIIATVDHATDKQAAIKCLETAINTAAKEPPCSPK